MMSSSSTDTTNGTSTFMKSIVVTGGCGFIASNLVQYLVHKYPNYLIINLDKLSYCSSPYHHENIKDFDNYRFEKLDITNIEEMESLFSSSSIDYVFHLAAITHVDNSYLWPLQFTQTNVNGTQILLEMSRKYKVKRFILASTDEVYGGDSKEQMTEEYSFDPCNPYAASKAAAEFIAMSYWKSFGTPLIITRSNNAYGPGQYPEKVIPKFICRLNNDKTCCMYGTGTERRNFIYIDDVVQAYVTLMEKGKLGEAYNIGTHFHLSIFELGIDLTKRIKHIDDNNLLNGYIRSIPNRPINDFQYDLNFDKMKQLNWEPEISWNEGIEKTIDWYSNKDNLKRWINFSDAVKEHIHTQS